MNGQRAPQIEKKCNDALHLWVTSESTYGKGTDLMNRDLHRFDADADI